MSNLVSGILILASLGMFFGYVKPMWSADTSFETEFSAKSVADLNVIKGQYDDAFQKIAEIERVRSGLLAKYNGISEENRKKIEKILPSYVDSIRLIIDINSIAGAYGMTLANIKISEEAKSAAKKTATPASSPEPSPGTASPQVATLENKYSYVDVSFSVSGNYDSFMSFVSDLEKNLRVMDITSISFKSGEKDDTEYALSVRTYKLK